MAWISGATHLCSSEGTTADTYGTRDATSSKPRQHWIRSFQIVDGKALETQSLKLSDQPRSSTMMEWNCINEQTYRILVAWAVEIQAVGIHSNPGEMHHHPATRSAVPTRVLVLWVVQFGELEQLLKVALGRAEESLLVSAGIVIRGCRPSTVATS